MQILQNILFFRHCDLGFAVATCCLQYMWNISGGHQKPVYFTQSNYLAIDVYKQPAHI